MDKKILHITGQLIAKYGLKKFTVDEIASELKISKKTIYQYYESKEDIIKAYFDVSITKDQEHIKKELESEHNYVDKIYSIVYFKHQYKIPISILNDAKLFYPNEWKKIEEMKQYKLNAVKQLLYEASDKHKLKSDINIAVLTKMLEETSNMFIDYDFLIESKLKSNEAVDEAFKIILHGIL